MPADDTSAINFKSWVFYLNELRNYIKEVSSSNPYAVSTISNP